MKKLTPLPDLKHKRSQPLDISSVARPTAANNGLSARIKQPPNLFGLPYCPVFYPTLEEFRDPYRFFDSVKEAGEKWGLVKVVPPKGWLPPFSVDTEVAYALIVRDFGSPRDHRL